MHPAQDFRVYMKTPKAQACVRSTFDYLHRSYPPESTMSVGEGLYSGLKLPLSTNIHRLLGIYLQVGAKLRLVNCFCALRFKPRGFTDSQIAVLAMFFKLRVVCAERPDHILNGDKGLWAVPVLEAHNAPMPWPKVCSELASSFWDHDVTPFTVLIQLMDNVVKEMHISAHARANKRKHVPGLAFNILAELESEHPTPMFLSRMILDAQIPLRMAFANKVERAGDDGDFHLPAALREMLLDDAVLLCITKVSKRNHLFAVANIPKRLYDEGQDRRQNLFACCVIKLSSKEQQDKEWDACLDLGIVHFVFGKQPNFYDLLGAAIQTI